MSAPTAEPTPSPMKGVPNVTVTVVIETYENPSKVSWKIKIGSAIIERGVTGDSPYYEMEVDLNVEQQYKFVIIDKNNVKDTFYEVWKGGDVLISGDDFGRKNVNIFQV